MVQRIVWDGDQILYEIRAQGHHGATTAEMENDTTTVWGPLESAYGRVVYTHGPGIDQPLSLVRMGYTWGNGTRPAALPLAGAHEIVLSSNWRGSYDGGSIPDGSGRLPSATDQYGTLTMNIAWPAANHRAFLGQRSGVNQPSWMGSQLDQMRDASGLLYRRNRYYDPVAGRFTQEDPIGIAGGLNVYGYANGDPVNFGDPFGLCPYAGERRTMSFDDCPDETEADRKLRDGVRAIVDHGGDADVAMVEYIAAQRITIVPEAASFMCGRVRARGCSDLVGGTAQVAVDQTIGGIATTVLHESIHHLAFRTFMTSRWGAEASATQIGLEFYARLPRGLRDAGRDRELAQYRANPLQFMRALCLRLNYQEAVCPN